MKRARLLFNIVSGFGIFAIITLVFRAIIMRKVMLVFVARHPFDTTQFNYKFDIADVHQCLSILFGATHNLSADYVIFGLYAFIKFVMIIMSYRLRTVGHDILMEEKEGVNSRIHV